MRPWAELIDKIKTSTSTGQGSGAKNGGFPSSCWTFPSKMRGFCEEQQDAGIVIANSTFGAVLPLTILNAMEASHASKDDKAIRRHQPLIFALTESTTLLSAISTIPEGIVHNVEVEACMDVKNATKGFAQSAFCHTTLVKKAL